MEQLTRGSFLVLIGLIGYGLVILLLIITIIYNKFAKKKLFKAFQEEY